MKKIFLFYHVVFCSFYLLAASLNPSTVLYLNFEGEYNGSSYDSTSYQNHAIIQGANLVDTGKVGKAYSFGYSDTIRVLDSESLNIRTNSVTMMAWFQPTINIASMPSSYPILMIKRPWLEGGYAAHFLKSTGTIIMQYCWNGGSASTQSTGSLLGGNWYHYAGVLDGNTLRVYINGVLQSTSTTSSTMGSSAGTDLVIGGNYSGKIDEVSVWNTALTTSQIQTAYNYGNQGLSITGEIPLNVTPVIPEPSTILVVFLSGLFLLRPRKKI